MPSSRATKETHNADSVVLGFREASARDLAHFLRSFAAALAGSDIPVHAQVLLPDVLRHAERLDLKRVAIADACHVSEPTVSRWAAGQVKPHVIVARAAIEVVRDMALRRAQQCEDGAIENASGVRASG
jgi:hypothetical protein